MKLTLNTIALSLLFFFLAKDTKAQTCKPEILDTLLCSNATLRFKANAQGYSSYLWTFVRSSDNNVIGTSTDRDPLFIFKKPGQYKATLESSGTQGSCQNSIVFTVKPSPSDIHLVRLSDWQQCFDNNLYCIVDSSDYSTNIVWRHLSFGDGADYVSTSPEHGDTVCHSYYSRRGGEFSLLVELRTADGCESKKMYSQFAHIFPSLGLELSAEVPFLCDSVTTTITNRTYLRHLQNRGGVDLNDLSSFELDFGDGTVIKGDSNTNTEYWTGKKMDGILQKWYKTRGDFNLSISATASWGCSERFEVSPAKLQVSGSSYLDSNSNCKRDSGEAVIQTLIKLNDQIQNTLDSAGYKQLALYRRATEIKPVIPEVIAPLIRNVCPEKYTVRFDSLTCDTFGFDFGYDMTSCPILSLVATMGRLRHCTETSLFIDYQNWGFSEQKNVLLTVQMPEDVIFKSTNHTYSTTPQGLYQFDLGTVKRGMKGRIVINAKVSCDQDILNYPRTLKAWITPENTCYNQLNAADQYDSSNIETSSHCLGDSMVRFKIINNGPGGMKHKRRFLISTNLGITYIDSFLLANKDTMMVDIPADSNRFFRLEARQHPLYRYTGHSKNYRRATTTSIHNCGSKGKQGFSQSGSSTEFFGHRGRTYDEDSGIIRNSYDPNDKQVTPGGMKVNRFVEDESLLEYTIRFQNTGNDTAYRVVIEDYLDNDLDLSTLEWGSSSHSFVPRVSGNFNYPKLEFIFDDINLVDSSTNLIESQGFVKYKIRIKKTASRYGHIGSRAKIYFDFNAPITTNNPWVRLYNSALTDAHTVYVNGDKKRHVKHLDLVSCRPVYSPSGKHRWVNNGFYTDTLRTLSGVDSILHVNYRKEPLNNLVSIQSNSLMALDSNASFQWLNCDEDRAVIDGATDRIFTPAVNGRYAVELQTYGCIDTSVCYEIDGLSSITDLPETPIRIYPNPSREGFTLEFPSRQKNVEFKVMDVHGRYVINENLKAVQLHEFEVNAPAGLYVVLIRSQGVSFRMNVVKL
ncbi:MAG: T9SS type A sorting domain-containing protein [Bacteroidia bacterium]|nr:T9SS type A sorting domain-containing protein [Bacteroidia bacterium]